MGAKLAGELEGLDQAVQHGLAPVVDGLAQLHGTLGDAGPVGAVVAQGVGEVDPAQGLGLL